MSIPFSVSGPTPLEVLADSVPKAALIKFIVGVDAKHFDDCCESIRGDRSLCEYTLTFILGLACQISARASTFILT